MFASTPVARSFLFALVLALGAFGCGEDSAGPGTSGDPDEGGSDTPEPTVEGAPSPALALASVRSATPVLPGSEIEVEVAGLDPTGAELTLQLATPLVSADVSEIRRDGSTVVFGFDAAAAAAFGVGDFALELSVTDGSAQSDPFVWEATFAEVLGCVLDAGGDSQVHHDELWLVEGAGILAPGEGQTELRLVGTFTAESGQPADVDVVLPVLPAEKFARDRGLVLLGTEIGGLRVGAFAGEATLVSTLQSGASFDSDALAVELNFQAPVIFSVADDSLALGRYVEIAGAGFIGSVGKPGELTTLRVVGQYVADATGEKSDIDATVFPAVGTSDQLRFYLSAVADGERLVSDLFGARDGAFSGEIAVVTSNGLDELASPPLEVEWAVRTTGQVVYLRFLPGFSDSLELFGVGALGPEVEATVVDVIRETFAGYGLDVRTELPDDYDINHFSVVEIGGPDPNGIGLFGFDNTPGKDVGNLRLFDAIGGANAATQADGFPGFGGVFVEAFLFFSSDPPLASNAPLSSPPPEPLFDAIFDPVRAQPATLSEFQGNSGDTERVAAVQEAVRALGALIADTTSHEIGHSLGLADPDGPVDAFHNAVDTPGCIMDSGSARDFAERIRLGGADSVQFCYSHPDYLADILGPPFE